MIRTALIALFIFFSVESSAQVQDTLEHSHSVAAAHNIKLATTLALIPGAGQIYNKRYWKAPLVWGALGGVTYYYVDLTQDFNSYESVLQLIINEPTLQTRTELETFAPELFSGLPAPFYQNSTNGVAQEAMGYMEALRTQREYALFGLLGVYLLNILDANIDAHLFDFDVSDDLSLRPSLNTNTRAYRPSELAPGFTLVLAL
ncbi:MAG: DUF5683 domain-containing protein [Schleiferiaceae bacterium]|jgi:hypothetical protein|nr:DUF5683 domain-containing protein [Schleiferiaceae bacterium]MDP4766873.1 DUF5683 domain-containing protein [Schleiferiaceae bacterium]MDP4877842.1 DUF5683 domain-containing protein [Schleiferiaceae bacterium]MDP4958873.1 DUF5683 domain-containing protein [Schleiferiaceae bacterium]